MALDPRTPVIVGVGQYKQQLDDVTEAVEQVALMERALRAAADDAGAPGLLSSIDQLFVIGGLWRYPDPGRLIADSVGSKDASTYLTAMGGNMPQACVSEAAERVQRGDADVIVVTGGEAVYSKNKLRKLDRDFPRSGHDLPAAERFGADVTMSSEHEQSLGFSVPTSVYPLFESAVRAASGRGFDEHHRAMAELWASNNAVAAANPYAWVRTPMTAEEILEARPDNRMVGFPYTKAMNANSFVDFGAAIIVTSAEKAEALGIARDRWVFPQAATDGHATLLFSRRDNFHESPAIRHTGGRCLELAGVGVDDIGPMDLYSCFPSVVQITMNELGIGRDRTVSTTGGLSFFGGPMNSYVLHAIASTVDAVRALDQPGFVHANGGYATKHACAVYATEPPRDGFVREDVQPAIDRHPAREVDETPDGDGTIESCTVLFGRDGPQRALLTALMPDGRRALAGTDDVDTMVAMTSEEFVGRLVTLRPDGEAEVR